MDTVTRASVEEFVVKWYGPKHEKAVIDEIGRYAEHVARLPTIDPRTFDDVEFRQLVADVEADEIAGADGDVVEEEIGYHYH
ncbi:hypothetical protein ATCC90586_009158 [Pythium insidiosum]|nr:hypothetical protein ATCC90586_009158 [Pythium insidiosum]